MNKSKILSTFLIAVLTLQLLNPLTPKLALAQVPFQFVYQFVYQGVLRAAGGGPVVTGNKSFQFKLLDQSCATPPCSGNILWDSLAQTVSVDKGVFRYVLGNPANPLQNVNWEQDVFLEISIEGSPLLPREKLRASPYAFLADKAEALTAGNKTIQGKLTIDDGGSVVPLKIVPRSSLDMAAISSLSIGGPGSFLVTPKAGASVAPYHIWYYNGDAVSALDTWFTAPNYSSTYFMGDVGIGTDSPPAEKLDVLGNIKASGNLILGGTMSGDSITDGTIDSSKIQDNTLTAADLATNSVGISEASFANQNLTTTSNVTFNNVNVNGTVLMGLERISVSVTMDPAQQGWVVATCPAGKSVLSGGFYFNASDVRIIRSQPVSGTQWQCNARNLNSSFSRTMWCWAVCARAN